MQIIKTIPEQLTNRQLYDLTMSPKTQKMSDAKGSRLEIAAVCIYEDADKKTGELRKVLALLTPDGEIFATNSATFQDDFSTMCEMFGDTGVTAVEVISGTSKAGREFITCAYAGD